MNRKGIKKIMLFLLAFMLVFPVYSFGKAEALQATMLCVRQKIVPGKKSKL